MRPWLAPRHRSSAYIRVLFAGTSLVVLASGCSGQVSSTGGRTSPRTSSASVDSGSAGASTDLITDVELTGRRIHVTCFGPTDETGPTVLFESGGDEPSDIWDTVVDALSATRRTCAYDRAGTGASPLPPTAPRTTRDLVADLEVVLEKAHIDGPFVLVGHSIGVWPISVYAAAHPADVAGVVLVDPRGPHVSARWLAALPPRRPAEPEAVRLNREDLTVFEHDASMNREHLDVARSADEAGAVLDVPGPLFGDAPMTVLGAANTHLLWDDLPPRLAKTFDRVWLGAQKALAAESSIGTFQMVAESGHGIEIEQPQAVIDAIESVLADALG